jgi:hypothetical protein
MTGARQEKCRAALTCDAGTKVFDMTDITQHPDGCNDHTEYLLGELRCAGLRARLWVADIDAVGSALRCGLISPDQAVEALADCDALHLMGSPPTAAEEAWQAPNWATAAAQYHADRRGRAA